VGVPDDVHSSGYGRDVHPMLLPEVVHDVNLDLVTMRPVQGG
jgi:hypothetical protein